jgi:hypothetical protein
LVNDVLIPAEGWTATVAAKCEKITFCKRSFAGFALMMTAARRRRHNRFRVSVARDFQAYRRVDPS